VFKEQDTHSACGPGVMAKKEYDIVHGLDFEIWGYVPGVSTKNLKTE
jgi:hypothetical protein